MKVRQQVKKLINNGFYRKACFKTWVANYVMVKKVNEKLQMCIYDRVLNKSCSNDSYPLHRIDQLVDTTSVHETLRFMDAYSGNKQIRIHPGDKVHTTFYADTEVLCYSVMSTLKWASFKSFALTSKGWMRATMKFKYF